MAAVRIISAAEIDPAEKKKLEAAWDCKSGEKCSYVYEIVPGLASGIRIEGGDFVKVVSAAEIAPAQREKLEAAWDKKTGRACVYSYGVSPSLIGGIRIEDGDSVYDASLAGRLEKLRKAML